MKPQDWFVVNIVIAAVACVLFGGRATAAGVELRTSERALNGLTKAQRDFLASVTNEWYRSLVSSAGVGYIRPDSEVIGTTAKADVSDRVAQEDKPARDAIGFEIIGSSRVDRKESAINDASSWLGTKTKNLNPLVKWTLGLVIGFGIFVIVTYCLGVIVIILGGADPKDDAGSVGCFAWILIGVGLTALYFLVRFVKWAWER